ncbi:hypothetical protein FVB9288_02260 [Flavobacterium sp. CECT 9288]|uniref:hypothetical protein n=1 Tax=Flavobacterium sp. CECT 9288 TaxID=2845819 RepID=UPI001E5A74B9|nr:hypothetical protein [Flavobacterium sp. CECT 9288]CAH0336554.1 hypothetical protein FVB9288_02260 [Flavobacterium sp. CECT 9288]
MITKYKKHHRIIATIFLLIFFPTLVPNNLFASNNGPKSPEAASFEPVDATDMVNLITGQYSYVLPLLNVPSPEGGYPIALGYHAGIAMDQESSWAGLGWNVNPGAIDRNVNGYPDDYNASELNEYFWDKTSIDSRYTASLGFTSLTGISVGVGFNWGNNQALGGSVSVGVGPDLGAVGTGVNVSVGTNGASIGIGVSMKGGLSYGVSVNTNGDVGLSAGFSNNDAGFSIGYNTNGTTSLGISGGTGKDNNFGLDVSLSSRGIGISGDVTNKTGKNIDGGAGAGMFLSFNNSVAIGDYATSSTGWMIPIFVPTPIGIFSASFGKQEFKYWLGKNVKNYITGPINFKNKITDIPVYSYAQPTYVAHRFVASCQYGPNNSGYCQYNNFGINGAHGYRNIHTVIIACNPSNTNDGFAGPHSTFGNTYVSSYERGFMDINEISLNSVDESLSTQTDVVANNMTFPAYDNFSTSGQGVSGSMTATHYKNGALFGLDGKENKEGYSLKYAVRAQNAAGNDITKFNTAPQFEFDNEIASFLEVNPAQFKTNINNTVALDYYSSGVDINDQARRKTSSYIEYYTNDQITSASSYASLKTNGFLLPNVSGFDRSTMPKNGIGAFKVTTVDGKTYHYSLPVYNHEIITRTYGVIPNRTESESYFEKRQLEPFATHWLLTAVTGPDFVDNGDGVANDGDLGYWTSFEYGKWTDAFTWKNPYKKEALIDDNDPSIKTWIRGRKQLYYLDKITTRTHTALFIKGVRQDAPSPEWSYNSADHIDNRQNNVVVNGRFIVPLQNQLRLEKIILLKNSDYTVDKKFGADANQSFRINYNQSKVKEDLEAKYNIYDNVLDVGDNWSSCLSKAVKVIDFNYDYSLVPGDNRLTLKSVDFKGKGASSVLPPYKFDYINDTNTFNIDNKDGWGYPLNPETFSLNKITTPQGGTINIGYETNKFKSVTPVTLEFSNTNSVKYISTLPNPFPTSSTDLTAKKVEIEIGGNQNYPLVIGQNVTINYLFKYLGNGSQMTPIFERTYVGSGTITAMSNILGTVKYEVTFDSNPVTNQVGMLPGNIIDLNPTSVSVSKITVAVKLENSLSFTGGGARVANLKISDGVDNYFTDYRYGHEEDGIGYVSYVPYSQNVVKEVPYSTELPAPRVMYEYVTVSSHKEGVLPEAKMRYRFNVMKEKSKDKVKFGEFYEIVKTSNVPFTNTANNKEVSINSFTVKENFAALGQLLEVSTLNSQNQLLSKVYSNYYDINSIPGNMGVTQESYQSYKEVDYTNTALKDKWLINSSTRIKYPSIVKSSTEQSKGYTYTTQFNDYDLVSGVSKEQVYTSSDGQSFKTRTIPAYIKYPEMGSKVDNINNKNMLSQTAVNYSYILDKNDVNNPWKETGVGITTWSNIWSYKDITGTTFSVLSTAPEKDKIWRKHKTYVWNGIKDTNGIFTNYDNINGSKDDNFNWTIGVGQPAQWKQTSEVTLYDHFSSPLEMKDINGNKASTKMGDNESKIMVTGNAGYNEIFYTGAENLTPATNWLEPEVQMTNALRNTAYFHTGKHSVQAGSDSQFGVVMKNGQHRAGKYRVSVWVEKANAANAAIKVNGSIIPFKESYTAGNWVFKSAIVEVPLSECSIYIFSNTRFVYLDDLMIRPVASSISGYVYNQWDELSHIIGNNGLATRFEYDNAGRLVKTYSEVIDDVANGVTGGFKLSKSNTYNNKHMQ